MWKKFKSIDYRHWICLAVVLGSVVLGVFVYEYPFVRLIEAVNDLWRSVAYAFTDLLELSDHLYIKQTVNNFSRVDLWQSIGIDTEMIGHKFTGIWSQIFVGTNMQIYLIFLLYHFTQFLFYFCFVMIGVLIITVPIILTWDDANNDYNKDTVPLVIFKLFVARPLRIIVNWLKELWEFFRYSAWFKWFLFIWLLHFGVYTVVIEFLAYYFWVLTAFDISTIGIQLLKLAVDLLLGLNTLPWYAWAALALWGFELWRVRHGTDKLYHLDARNKGLLNELPMYLFLSAPPRSGKGVLRHAPLCLV